MMCGQRQRWYASLTAVLALAGFLLIRALPVRAGGPQEQKLVLLPSMLLNETAVGETDGLVDEQEIAGDPAAGKGGKPKKPFFPGWGAWIYPVHVSIDLGAKHRISRIFFYNETGESDILLSSGQPFAWQEKPVHIAAYQNWVEIPFPVETRWLRITMPKPTSMPEMVVYGELLEKPASKGPIKPPSSPRPRIPIDQFIGTNAFIDDPLDTISGVAGFEREYHSWGWDVENKDLQRRFQPSAAGGGAWRFDDYYAGLKGRGVTVAPVLQMGVPELVHNAKAVDKPVAAGRNTEDPASYALHAAHMFQYAARYGGTKVEDSRLELAPGQPRASGLGLLRYLENWNEPDRTWDGRDGRFHPYELAAMSSADYDGHQGKLGRDYGVKSADPKMKLVLAGLAGLDLPYLRAMKFWADGNRGGSFPADVINLHHYSSTGNEQGFKPDGQGISPEADKLRERMAAFTAWRDANVPNAELWLTEFGYDTNSKSPLHSPAIGKLNGEEVQAIWLVRAYFALAAAGVDRAAMFMLRDVNSAGAGVFETCGLVTEKGKWAPKPSWYYVATLKTRLAGMVYDSELPSGRPDVLIYRFRRLKPETGKPTTALAVWCPTSEDKHVAGYRLVLPGKSATLVRLTAGKASGSAASLALTDGKATLEVSETPVLVLYP